MGQADRLLAFLRAHPGCSALEITYGLEPFVANPRARISDLRAKGHTINAERDARGVFRFYLVEAPVQLAAFG